VFFSEKQLLTFHKNMNNSLKNSKAKIDKFYYCSYHPEGKINKYRKVSSCRKPDNGMLIAPIKKYKLKTSDCFMIGDEKKDFLSLKKIKIDF